MSFGLEVSLCPTKRGTLKFKEASEESEERKAKKLLNELELGDKKPSVLLREMKNLANDKVTDYFLRTMFLQRLPNTSRAILVASTDNVENLAKMADKIVEINSSDSQYICADQSQSSQSLHKDRLSILEDQMSDLVASVKEYKSSKHFRNRSNSRENLSKTYRYCWYHYKFKENARKCIQPCSFKTCRSITKVGK
ncbi:unnamed protein product [Psylliodes chrysocephalus]|uniref:Uncharacterized protein n=1 Tax=Psylliodes chrysocephalus TaxID=3402493 RepID=A0A9P0D126_9CUCU|nr:unnamed protein product [Psylliodes chrysocephala]